MKSYATYSEGVYGPAARIRGPWSDQLARQLKSRGVVDLTLNEAFGWKGDNVDFLAEFSELLRIDILDWYIKSVQPIHHLKQLRDLGVSTYCSTPIQFQGFPRLETVGLEWRPRCESLFGCTQLKRLFLNRYKGSSSKPFASLLNLEELRLLGSKLQEIKEFRHLSRVKRLQLGLLPALASLEGIEGMSDLVELEIDTCKRITSLEPLSNLTSLKSLVLSNLGDIDSIAPVAKLNNLELITFVESTNILDGNIGVLDQLPGLKTISFMNRKHYDRTRESFGARYFGKSF